MTDYEKIEAVNWSTLVHLATSARLLAWRKDHPREETRALRIGTAIHRALLEPERFASEYVAEPDVDGRTKDGKAAKAAFRASLAPTSVVIDADEHALVVRCAENASAHPAVRDLLRGGHAEETLTWHDQSGIACKGRVDYLAPGYLLDIKSTRAETLLQLGREIAGRLYHGQLAFYLDGAVASKRVDALASQVFVVAVQTVEPFDVMPVRIMPEDIERGRSLYRSLLRQYAECQAANYWPGLAPQIVNLALPEWADAGEADDNNEEEW